MRRGIESYERLLINIPGLTFSGEATSFSSFYPVANERQ